MYLMRLLPLLRLSWLVASAQATFTVTSIETDSSASASTSSSTSQGPGAGAAEAQRWQRRLQYTGGGWEADTQPPFTVISGDCVTNEDGSCVSSPNYPNDYPNTGGDCEIAMASDTTLSVVAFDTETAGDVQGCYDHLTLRAVGDSEASYYCSGSCDSYSGDTNFVCGSEGPDGVQADAEHPLTWHANDAGATSGWQICASTGTGTDAGTAPAPRAALFAVRAQSDEALQENRCAHSLSPNLGAHPSMSTPQARVARQLLQRLPLRRLELRQLG